MMMIRQLIFPVLFLVIAYDTTAETKSFLSDVPHTIRLSNGYEMPVVGFGTYEIKASEAEKAVNEAIDVGYTHFDTAYVYGNEKEIGKAINQKISDGTIKREDIFVTTKLGNAFHEPELVHKQFNRSFDNLNLTYIDLFLIHFPAGYGHRHKDGSDKVPEDVDDFVNKPTYKNGSVIESEVDYIDTWRAMEDIVKSGRVRSIGVSNFNSEQVERLNALATIKPVTNQVECHPNLNQRKFIEFCAERNITITAYSPIGRPYSGDSRTLNIIQNPKVVALAEKYNKTPVQIILRYTVQNGAIVIPRSTKRSHMEENINIFDFILSDCDMEIMHGLNSNTRLFTFLLATQHKYYPFNIEF